MTGVDDRGLEIGLATTVKPKQHKTDGKVVLRPSLQFCRMARHAHQFGAHIVLFAPDDVDWERGHVIGWVPAAGDNPLGNWIKKRTRLPDAIYENVFVHIAVRGFTASMRKAARARGIPVFNPPLFNKLQMGEWLSGTELKRYVPETFRLADVDKAVASLRRWEIAYLKPIGGYGGVGVTRIEHINRNRYRVSIDRKQSGGQRERVVLSEQALRHLLQARKRIPHLFQKGLRLLTIGGRKVDFRVVVHRDVEGRWRAVGVVPKQASLDGVVTNLIAGGERLTLAQCVDLALQERKAVPVSELEQCALRIAQRMSDVRPRTGLIGFDLGVDEKGRVLMIEMNPKPARSLLSAEMKKKAAEYSAGFAVFLAKQKRHRSPHNPNHVL